MPGVAFFIFRYAQIPENRTLHLITSKSGNCIFVFIVTVKALDYQEVFIKDMKFAENSYFIRNRMVVFFIHRAMVKITFGSVVGLLEGFVG